MREAIQVESLLHSEFGSFHGCENFVSNHETPFLLVYVPALSFPSSPVDFLNFFDCF